MNINNVCFWYIWRFFNVHAKTGFVLTLFVCLTFGRSQIFSKIFAYVWLEVWDISHTSNARWLAFGGLHVLAWEFVEMVTYRFVPSSGSHKHFAHFLGEFDWWKVFLQIWNMTIFCASIPSILWFKNSTGLFVPLLSLVGAHLPCFNTL